MKSRKQISKEEQDQHTLAEQLREEKKKRKDEKYEERPDHMAPQSGMDRHNWPGRGGGHS